ncbi:MAG: cupredoxin domain-containing protein [Polyangia bacterium]
MASFLRQLGAWGRPLDVSAQGWRGDELFGWISIVVTLALVVVLVQLALVVVRSRRLKLPGTTNGESRTAQLIVVVGSLLLFLLVDGVALLRGWDDLSAGLLRTPAASERVVNVEVLAQQWAWTFRLAGDDGTFGTDDDVVVMHALHLPAGRPAQLELRSKDVMHSLYVPQLRLKRDAQPGATTELLLEPTRQGQYEIACTQHCGLNHYKMRATLDVMDSAAFERWAHEESVLAKQRASARTSDGMWAWPFGKEARK